MGKETDKNTTVLIKPPNFSTAVFHIIGTAPLVINKFSRKAREEMKAKQVAGSRGKKGILREGKDFDRNYKEAFHVSKEGWNGIPAASIRAAMIRACSLVGYKMTIAKMAVFIEADGFDADEGTPLVKISKGTPHSFEMCVRNETGVPDIRIRPMWDTWGAIVRIRYDADQFSVTDVTNLLLRAGMQVGICEGRPGSKDSAGMGWGTFTIEEGKR